MYTCEFWLHHTRKFYQVFESQKTIWMSLFLFAFLSKLPPFIPFYFYKCVFCCKSNLLLNLLNLLLLEITIIMLTIATTMAKLPCDIYRKVVTKRHEDICCDLCGKWIRMAYNNLDKKHTRIFSWSCMSRLKKISVKGAPMIFLSLTRRQSIAENVNVFKINPKISLTVNAAISPNSIKWL